MVSATEKCVSKVRDTIWNKIHIKNIVYDFLGATALQWARVSSFKRFIDNMKRRTTIGRVSLDE